MMKAVTFTLDALFAIVIASIGVSMLLFFHSYSPTPFIISSGHAGQTLLALTAENISSLANPNGTNTASAIMSQNYGSGETWTQYLSDSSRSGSNAHGPSKAFVSEIISVGNTVTTGIVAEYGDIFFGAGSDLYAVNASGRILWIKQMGSSISTTPAVYDGKVIVWNSPNVTAINAYNGSISWTTNALSATLPSTPISVYDGELILGAQNQNIYTMDSNNGTITSTTPLASGFPISIAVADGSIAAMGSVRDLYLFTNINSVPTQAQFFGSYQTAKTSGVAAEGKILLYGDGIVANESYINGTKLYSYASPSQVVGVAYSAPYAAYQGSNSISVLSSSGSTQWETSVPSAFGSAPSSANPVIGGGNIYTVWSNGHILAQNISSSATAWSTRIPYPGLNPNLTLAYGRLYAAAGNTIIAYGACNVNPSESLLSSAVSSYLYGDGGCGDYLLNSVAPMNNYSVFYGQALLPVGRLANFNGKNSYAVSGGNYSAPGGLTISAWVYPKAYTGKSQFAIDSNPQGVWRIGFNSTNSIVLNPGTASNVTLSNTIAFDKWQSIIISAGNFGSNVIYSVYLNGVNVSSGIISGGNIDGINNLTFSSINYPFNGSVANVQIYNYLITPHEAQQLYRNGIQGSPLSNLYLMSWYPLDGSFNDFGPKSNAAYPFNVSYSQMNYTPTSMQNAFEISKAGEVVPAENFTSGAENTYPIGVYAWR